MIQASIYKLNNLIELQKAYLYRADKGAKTKKINSLEQQIEQLLEENARHTEETIDDFYLIPKSGFSVNYMYSWGEKGTIVKSRAYRRWINDLHLELYLPREYPNVNFAYPIRITAMFGQKEGMDTNNFGKALIDQIAEYYCFDDVLVHDSRLLLHDFVDSYEEGYIFIKIENI